MRYLLCVSALLMLCATPVVAQIIPQNGGHCTPKSAPVEYTEFRSDKTRLVKCTCEDDKLNGNTAYWECTYQ